MKADDLHLGMLLSYKGRRPLLGIRGWHVGQVVGLEPGLDTVHLATLVENVREEILEVDVAFLPLTRSAFERSALGALGADLPVTPFSSALLTWRRRRQGPGDVAAFSVPAWEAESLAWETLLQHEPNATIETTIIDYAWPARGRTGQFRTVEIATRPRPTFPRNARPFD